MAKLFSRKKSPPKCCLSAVSFFVYSPSHSHIGRNLQLRVDLLVMDSDRLGQDETKGTSADTFFQQHGELHAKRTRWKESNCEEMGTKFLQRTHLQSKFLSFLR